MNFETSENLKMIAETARDFAEKIFALTLWTGMNLSIFQKTYFISLVKWALWELLSLKNMEVRTFLR